MFIFIFFHQTKTGTGRRTFKCQRTSYTLYKNNKINKITQRYDYKEAILVMGSNSPVITGNTVSGADYFMIIRTSKHTDLNVNRSNPRYKKLLKYAEVKNDFGEKDFQRLGFYDNTLNIKNKTIRYRNSYLSSYTDYSLE